MQEPWIYDEEPTHDEREEQRWATPADIADIEIPQAYIHVDGEGILTDVLGNRLTVAEARKHAFGLLRIEVLAKAIADSMPPDFDSDKNFAANIWAKYKKSWGDENE